MQALTLFRGRINGGIGEHLRVHVSGGRQVDIAIVGFVGHRCNDFRAHYVIQEDVGVIWMGCVGWDHEQVEPRGRALFGNGICEVYINAGFGGAGGGGRVVARPLHGYADLTVRYIDQTFG